MWRASSAAPALHSHAARCSGIWQNCPCLALNVYGHSIVGTLCMLQNLPHVNHVSLWPVTVLAKDACMDHFHRFCQNLHGPQMRTCIGKLCAFTCSSNVPKLPGSNTSATASLDDDASASLDDEALEVEDPSRGGAGGGDPSRGGAAGGDPSRGGAAGGDS